jgi:formylmethanofuran dehydrogenase subunit C
MALTIQIRDNFWDESSIPLEVDSVAIERLRELSLDEIKQTLIWQGKMQLELGEAFQISGSLSDSTIDWHGDLSRVHWIGAKQAGGRTRIHGSVGRHLGSQMTGGELEVIGDAGDFVGVEMTGGTIRVSGNAGNRVGARYPGSRFGMNRGSVFVGGNVGHGLGENMRRGNLVVSGNAGDAVGWNILAGTICVMGSTGENLGAGMVRGSIICGQPNEELLPTFLAGTQVEKVEWMRIFARWLDAQKLPMGGRLLENRYQHYSGDSLYGGRGEIWMAVA